MLGKILPDACDRSGHSLAFLLYIDPYKLFPPQKLPPENERKIVHLPAGGESISIENALNSRCTSDYDDDPKYFHWGMFDHNKKLSLEQIRKIVDLVNIPRFTSKDLEIRIKDNLLTFVVDPTGSTIQREWTMIECGMQQQSIGLICAALGVGMVFKSFGKVGKSISDVEYATIRIKLDPMKPSYNGSYWSDSVPQGKRPWLKGNLPDPIRNGNTPLVNAFKRLRKIDSTGRRATFEDAGQLLWAARGRTPHYYISKPWGMTIPTNFGRQDITDIYLLSGNELFIYSNWKENRADHSVLKFKEIEAKTKEQMLLNNKSYSRAIILAVNEVESYAFWEIGYQLLNLLLQAYSLNINYSAILLDDEQRAFFETCGIMHPAALISF